MIDWKGEINFMEELFDILDENGEYLNEVATRDNAHKKGLWHRAVVLFIISSDNKRVLLQQRSANKKMWPNLWDITSGGHVLSNELGYQSVIRETKEELGLDIKKESLEFIGEMRSVNVKGDIIDKHFNEFFIAHSDIDIDDLVLQEEEVQDIKWFDKEEVIERYNNNYDGLTTKKGCWEYLLKYFEFISK